MSASKRIEKQGDRRAGFTLIEALVALALVLAFAAVLGPFMFHSRRILLRADGQVNAEQLLRSLLATPFDRARPETGTRTGEAGDLHWRLDVEPDYASAIDAPSGNGKNGKNKVQWIPFRVRGQVAWGDGKMIAAETLRLGAAE